MDSEFERAKREIQEMLDKARKKPTRRKTLPPVKVVVERPHARFISRETADYISKKMEEK